MAQSLALKTAGLPFLQEIVSRDLRTQLCSASAHIIRDSAIISLLKKEWLQYSSANVLPQTFVAVRREEQIAWGTISIFAQKRTG
jgi:hypothetical protein